MIVKSWIEGPFKERASEDGVMHYHLYMTQALAPATVQPEAGKLYVELHWIGRTCVEWDPESAVTPIPSGARLYDTGAIPINGENLVMVRPGLPPLPFESFNRSFFSPDWHKVQRHPRLFAKQVANQQEISWDFGAAPNRSPCPIVTQVDAPEIGKRVEIEWHLPPGSTFDLVVKARFGDEMVEKSTPAREFLESRVSREDWIQYLSKINYISAVEALPASLSAAPPGVEPALAYSARIHIATRMNSLFMAGRSFYLLTYCFDGLLEKPEVPIQLAVWAQDRPPGGAMPHDLRRHLGIWPTPNQIPLPSISPPEDIVQRLENIGRRLDRLRSLDPTFSIPGADTHRYIGNRPEKESEIQEDLESVYDIRVPTELRWYWLYLSGGRVGPGQGLYTVRKVRNGIWCERDFPLPPQSLNDPAFPQFEEIKFELADAVTIAKGAEGEEFRIKISGGEIGTMWRSNPNLESGELRLLPLKNRATGGRLGFFDWYEAWLEDSIASLLP